MRQEWAQIESMIERSERQLAAFETGRDQEAKRLEELRNVVGSLRGTVEEKMDEQARRIGALEAGPMKQIAQAAAGLESKAEDDTAGPKDETEGDAPKTLPAAALDPTTAVPDDDAYDPAEEASGARWIFLVLAALLGLALLAQWLQMT